LLEADVDGTPFGRYRLIVLLGRGGMGEVWRAHDTDTDRIVALKLLPQHLADDETFVQRFRREAHAAARLNSPHVVPIHYYGEIDGRLYVDMRLIKGRDLQAVLADGPLEPGRAVRIIEQVAEALHAAHEIGLVHRDVKPSNILLDKNDFAYLIDFGIARAAEDTKLTSTGSMIGTLQYIAPERLGTGEVDARADIYALACVLYECLTGSPPFPGESAERLMIAHLSTPPPQPSTAQPEVPRQFDQVIATGMAKDPDQRYATTVELARAAHDAITTPIPKPVPVPQPMPSPSPPPPAHAGDLFASQPTQQRSANEVATQQAPPIPPAASPTNAPSAERPLHQRLTRRTKITLGAVALLVVIAVAVATAVALTSKPDQRTASPLQRGIVVLLIDVSRSMAATDVSPSRLEAAKVGATRFAEQLNPRLSVGLIAFAGGANMVVSPKVNREATKEALGNLQLADRTATGEGIFTALQTIATVAAVIGADEPPPRWIVLLSDGKETVPSNPDDPKGAYTAARTAKEQSVPISTISLGTPDGYVEIDDQRQPTPVDDSMLRGIANITGGSFYSASTIDQLNAAYDSLVKEIG
jgi:serine/threonine protein kinase